MLYNTVDYIFYIKTLSVIFRPGYNVYKSIQIEALKALTPGGRLLFAWHEPIEHPTVIQFNDFQLDSVPDFKVFVSGIVYSRGY